MAKADKKVESFEAAEQSHKGAGRKRAPLGVISVMDKCQKLLGSLPDQQAQSALRFLGETFGIGQAHSV